MLSLFSEHYKSDGEILETLLVIVIPLDIYINNPLDASLRMSYLWPSL